MANEKEEYLRQKKKKVDLFLEHGTLHPKMAPIHSFLRIDRHTACVKPQGSKHQPYMAIPCAERAVETNRRRHACTHMRRICNAAFETPYSRLEAPSLPRLSG